jgi:acyl carrier protein
VRSRFDRHVARIKHGAARSGETSMPQQFQETVLQALALRLGVPAREISLTHDLYLDWGLTPLSLVVVLLDLERSAAVELPSQELCSVRTVADLVVKFRAWVQDSDAQRGGLPRPRARSSRSAQSERRFRRELHHLRWLEHHSQTRRSLVMLQAGKGANAARRTLNR